MSTSNLSLARSVIGGALTFTPVCLVAWTYWQVLEGEQNTLYRSQFGQWTIVTLLVAAFVGIAVIAMGRARAVRLGAIVGLVLAAGAVVIGLVAEIADSGGFV